MARGAHPNSANSQFFIVLKNSHFLDGKYTVWGYVTQGMEYVDNIKKGDSNNNGSVADPADTIIWLRIASTFTDEDRKKYGLENIDKETKKRMEFETLDIDINKLKNK